MSTALQVALFIASIAIVVLVASIIPLAFRVRKIAEEMACSLKEFKADAHYVKQQSEELVRNLNELTRRANQQMEDISHVVRTARQWTERADELIEEVEKPAAAFVRNLNLVRTGVSKFLDIFLHHNHQTHKEIENE